MITQPNATRIADFVAERQTKPLAPDVIALARQSLIDWFAVCLAATRDPEAAIVARTIHAWRSQGRAVAVDGGVGSAAPIALINGTYSHALDFDDFHIASIHHAGGATFAAALAVAMERDCSGADVLRAFVAGFEVGTHLGMGGLGLALANAGWHPSSVLGCFSAAVASAVLLRLEPDAIRYALGFAAAQVDGLMASAGSIAKPLLVGKAASSGVLAATLAASGAQAPTHYLEAPSSVFATLLHDDAVLDLSGLGNDWQTLRNTFKPYACCQLTHAPIDAARAVASHVNVGSITSVRAQVNPFAVTIAGKEAPAIPLQAKFSLKHCIAMALLGHGATPADFDDARVHDPVVIELRGKIEISPTDAVARTAARLEVRTTDGRVVTQWLPAALGSLERPMSMADTVRKFLDSVLPILDQRAEPLLRALHDFEDEGGPARVARLLAGSS